MATATTSQLKRWLEQHTTQIVERWATLMRESWPAAQPELAADSLTQLLPVFGAATDDRGVALYAQIAALPADWSALGVRALLDLPLNLHRSITELHHSGKNGAGAALRDETDALLHTSIATLTRFYSETVEHNLRDQMEQAEYLLTHQSNMADESDRLALQLATLYETSQTLSASLDRQQLLANIGPYLINKMSVNHVAIIESRPGATWEVIGAWGTEWVALNGITLPPLEIPPAMRIVYDTRSPHIMHVEDEQAGWLLADQDALFVPMTHETLFVGYLVAQAPTIASNINTTVINMWRTIANQVTVALENTRLYDEINELNTDLERKVMERTAELREERDRLEAISDIARDISTLETDVLLQRTLQALSNLTGVHHGSVMLVDAGTGLLVDRAILTENPDYAPGFTRFQIGEGIVGWIAQYRQPVLVNDVTLDDRWVELTNFGQRVGKKTGSLVGVPLIAGDDIVGVLMLSHPQTSYFNQSHLRVLKAIAGEIAIGVYNAQLYEYLGERTAHLSRMLRFQEEATSQINSILQSLLDAVIVVNTDRNIILANAAASRLIDLPLDEILTKTFDELLEAMQLHLPGDPLRSVLSKPMDQQGRPTNLSMLVQRGTQSLQVSVGPVVTDRGELLGACLIGRDITREVESDRLKTEFIGTVSHELRTPMTSIKGYTQLLAMGSLGEVNETQREFLNTITTNAERMISIINDLLDITQIETGSVELNITALTVSHALSEVISDARNALATRNQELSLNLVPGLPSVSADPERLYQVLENLLDNAIKYTPPGGRIVVHAALVERDAIPSAYQEGLSQQRHYVQISIQDTGVGIAPNEHQKVFDRFYRTENPLKIEAGGTGLGLSLVRSLLHLMGGRIWLESGTEGGSVFRFILPAAS